MSDLGLLLLRLVLGLYLMGHGSQKLLGWFGGPGLKGATAMFAGMGFRPAQLWVLMAAGGEFAGGIGVALGFLSPLGPLAVAAAMAVATFGVHWAKGPWAMQGGYELSLVDLVIAVALGLTGPGRFSLDAVLHTTVPTVVALVLTALTIVVVLVAMAGRQRPAAAGGASKAA